MSPAPEPPGPGDADGPDRDTPDGSWYAVHTRSRHERKVAAELSRRGFEIFLPEYQSWSRRRDRRQRITRILFPGYLFVHTELTPALRLEIIQAASVVAIVGAAKRPVPIPDEEVESIRRLLGASSDAEPRPGLARGQLVQVLEGPLMGVIGRVEQAERGRRIVVSVELLGRSVAANLETEALAPYLD